MIFVWQILLKLYPVSSLPTSAIEEEGEIKLDGKQKMVCGIFLLAVAGWMTSGLHPLTNGQVGTLLIILVFGLKLLKIEDFNKLSWHVLMILGGGLSLGVAIGESGMAGKILEYLPADQSEETLLSGVAVIGGFLSTFISNTAAAGLVVPLAIHLEAFAVPAVLLTALACSSNVSMPVSTPPNVLAFATGRLTFRDFFIPGIALSLFSFLLMIPFLPYAKFILNL